MSCGYLLCLSNSCLAVCPRKEKKKNAFFSNTTDTKTFYLFIFLKRSSEGKWREREYMFTRGGDARAPAANLWFREHEKRLPRAAAQSAGSVSCRQPWTLRFACLSRVWAERGQAAARTLSTRVQRKQKNIYIYKKYSRQEASALK